MKKILLIALLLVGFTNYSQNKVAQKIKELQSVSTTFKPISVLSVTSGVVNNEVDKVVDKATFATLKFENISDIVTNKYENIQLEIPYQNQMLSVLLYKVNPFAEGFHVDTNKTQDIAYQKGVYYRGIINGDYNSVGAFNFFNGEFNGVVSGSAFGNIVVGKLDRANNTSDYIVYSDANMKILNQFDCHVKEEGIPAPDNSEIHRDIESTRCVTMYFEIDNNLYVSNGSSTTATTNWMTSVFNNIQTLYNNDGITIALKSLYIWTDLDPYNGVGTASSDYLYLFHDTRPVFDGDVGQLVGIDPGGLGGVAVGINGLCSINNYSYSDVNFSFATVPNYSWTINVISHEFGHLLGSRHTHSCAWNGNNTAIDGCGQQAGYTEGTCATGPIPGVGVGGTIMSYCHLVSGVGVNLANGFGPQPTQAILNAVNGGTCLSLDCINTCINSISAINTTSITPNSVAITWTDLNTSQTSWQVAVTPFASTAIVWNTVSTNSYSISGLNPNTYYKIRVRPFCNGLTPTNRVQIFATTASNFCSGLPFTDTGGTGNYTDNESWIRTMMPTGPGLKIKVTFTSFNLEVNYDYLYIYDGPDEMYGDLTLGLGLTGTALPSPYTATASNISGALTFRFYSDVGVVASGWNATISCTGTLGENSNEYIDFSYSPNPTNGNVSIMAKSLITEVAVYNVTGQLLYKNTVNDLNTNVDIASFAVGTYFFKLKFDGEKEVNFKILKN